jgi:hypothetical protein
MTEKDYLKEMQKEAVELIVSRQILLFSFNFGYILNTFKEILKSFVKKTQDEDQPVT